MRGSDIIGNAKTAEKVHLWGTTSVHQHPNENELHSSAIRVTKQAARRGDARKNVASVAMETEHSACK